MNKNMKLFLMIAIIVLFVIFALILFLKKSEPKAVSCEPSSSQASCEKLSPASSSDVSEDWREYINSKLDFSMWVPKKSAFSINEFAPVNIIENNTNNTVYIGVGIESSTKDRGWVITTKQIKNDNDLETLIKEKFGSDCKMGKKEYLYDYRNNAVYNVETIQGEAGMDSNCPLYRYKVFYNEGLGKAMAMVMGQECMFSATLENYGAICYDDLMLNSFKFDYFTDTNSLMIN